MLPPFPATHRRPYAPSVRDRQEMTQRRRSHSDSLMAAFRCGFNRSMQHPRREFIGSASELAALHLRRLRTGESGIDIHLTG